VSIHNATEAENAMSNRFAQLSALAAAITVLPAFAPSAEHIGPIAAQEHHERLVQQRRSDDPRGELAIPGGLPGNSDRTEDGGQMRERGIAPRGKPAKVDKSKAKPEEGAKKDQR
jgi:hypothetical protein